MTCHQCQSPLEAEAQFCGMCGASATLNPMLGQTLGGRFLVEEKLGEGGFGSVYRGTQLSTTRPVALKVLHPLMSHDENVVARFRREGQLLCSLTDAHTITTYDFDQHEDGTLFIAMELLEGRSLHQVFQQEAPIAWRRMLKFVSQMCSSLHEAHGLGIVHRDLKPENIYLEPRPGDKEFVKILDFGIAKVLAGEREHNQGPQLTATGQTLGTLEYMSPEQLMGKILDGRSDIYGLGVVVYEMLTRQLPFPDALGPAALISAQLRQRPTPPSSVAAALPIPAEVDAFVLKMIEKEKRDRFRDVEDLRIAADRLLATGAMDSESLAGESSELTSVEIPRRKVSRGPTTAEAMRAATGSRGWLWASVIGIVALGAVIGAWKALF